VKDQYIIILHRSPETVAQRVSEAMGRGYMPHGSLFFVKDQGRYAQALIRKEENNEK
jgi:hypothetical protein